MAARPVSHRGVDVAIVTYNSADVIAGCLEALVDLDHGPYAVRIVVVDNCSSDGTPSLVSDLFPDVALVENQRNLGLATAWNQGLCAGDGSYVLVLNPDAQLLPGALDVLVGYLDANPEVAAAGPQLIGLDGEIQPSCRAFPTLAAIFLRGTRLDRLFRHSKASQRYIMANWDHREARSVDWVMGACILLRRTALEAVGLFDGAFFLYYEDIDWCYRAQCMGWQVHYVPQARVLHQYQRESARGLNRQLWYHLSSIARLFFKHRFLLLSRSDHG